MDWLDLLKNSQDADGPLYVQIMNRLRESIETGRLPDRSKLPTNREMATLLDVDRSTVSRAYTELVQAGLIESHVGRGTFVRAPRSKARQSHIFEQGQVIWSEQFSRKSNTVAELLSQQAPIVSKPGTISFAGGIPTEEFYPHEQFEEIVRHLLQSEDARELFSYSPTEGHPLLIKEVQKILAEQGVSAADD